MGSPFSGPTPPYTNPVINPQYFQPSSFTIADITMGRQTLVESDFTLNYVVGQLVRLLIPPECVCRELNNITAYVISIISPTEVLLDIDSTGFNNFVFSDYPQSPQILAVGDINSGIISSTGPIMTSTNVPGSFINISPQ